MGIILLLLSVAGAIVGLVCAVIILIAAFQDAIWKGLVSLFCGLYFLYYAFFEYDAENKWLIIAGWLVGAAVSVGLRAAAAGTVLPN